MDKSLEPMLEMFLFETTQLIEQLEKEILANEKTNCIEISSVNEIFRIMHTIKGSAAMMMFDDIANLAHSVEDLFFYLREDKPKNIDYQRLCDIVLTSIDFIKTETMKDENNQNVSESAFQLIEDINEFLLLLKGNNSVSLDQMQESNPSVSKQSKYRAHIFFENGCNMENIRAFNVIHKLKDLADDIEFFPADIIENSQTAETIREYGLEIIFTTVHKQKEIETFFLNADLVRDLEINEIESDELISLLNNKMQINLDDLGEELLQPLDKNHKESMNLPGNRSSLISVDVNKLDNLMDLVGELVISEAMVTHNPDLTNGINLDNFHKATRQHRKIINELQDIVMSIRMVPLIVTFQKMNRIVRDMSKKLNKEIELEIIGEETEVDKNIIEHLSDPLMHLIRNAIDHGIEGQEERLSQGKPGMGKIRLEAKNEGGDVWITVKDDGAGLNKEKIMARARENGLINRGEHELTDRDIFAWVLSPGFSTRDQVSEFSGRGVGMDVAANNIASVGGTVLVDSIEGRGTTVSLKIPLTLAIINGMSIQVGKLIYILPTRSVRESFRAKKEEIIHDPDGNEMVMVRDNCYPILRLHQRYKLPTEVEEIQDGIIVVVENDSKTLCLFADALLGEQQIVVKALPKYLKKISGISGCTLLGNGRASLILDVAGLINNY